MDKKKLEAKLQEAQFDVLRAKNYKALVESPAWLELTQGWLEAEQAHKEDKAVRSLFDYNIAKMHEWGTDSTGKVTYINGQQLMVEQQLEELRIEVFKGIMEEVQSLLKIGTDSAQKIQSYDERVTAKLKNKK